MKQSLFFVFVLVLLQYGCKKDSLHNCIEGTGSVTTETRNVKPFTQIELYNNVDLILHIDSSYGLTVTAGAHLVDGISTEVEDGILKLKNKNRCNWLRSFKNNFVVDVWVKSLNHITIYDASGNIDFADTLKQDFRFDSWSSTGDYHLKLNCNTATLALHTGPADLYAEGHVGVNYVYSVGYGKMDLRNVDADDVYVKNGGTNDLYINANKIIGATLTYVGNIYYRGNPSQVNEVFSNKGRLIKIN